MIDEGKLRAAVGPEAICAEVVRAIVAEAPTVQFNVEITVLSPARLTAKLIVEGRVLPLQNFAVMDANLSKGTVERFASSLAVTVKAAAHE